MLFDTLLYLMVQFLTPTVFSGGHDRCYHVAITENQHFEA